MISRVRRAEHGAGLNFCASVESPVADGFAQVGDADLFDGGEIGDGAGDFENAVIGAGGERQPCECLFNQPLTGGIEGAVAFDLGWGEGGVRFASAVELAGASGTDPRSHLGGCLGGAGGGAGELSDFKPEHFDMQVNAVEQGAGESRPIAGNLFR